MSGMNIFNTIMARKPKRNRFNLSHDNKLSLEMGKLVPIYCDEVIPGDIFKVKASQMLRLAPMVAPAMHQIDVTTHFFFVPNRLLWSNWEDFITGGEDGTSAPAYPVVTHESLPVGSKGDYMGLPTGVPLTTSAMYNSAYNFIWNEYYRDQNLQEKLNYKLVDGNQASNPNPITSSYADSPLDRAWAHDYFTAALPFAQKGDAVTLPLGTTADIIFNPDGNTFLKDKGTDDITDSAAPNSLDVTWDTNNPKQLEVLGALNESGGVNVDNSENLEVDLSNATASTINDLRRAFRLQEWLEKNARGGSRYIEHILSHFGVRSSDARLQRPEYLGGGKSPVLISEVFQTSSSVADGTPQGNLAGHGLSVGTMHSFNKRFEEHGIIIGIMSVTPKAAYQQGIPKMFTKFDNLDYYYPSFAHIGEQEVLNKELYADGTEEDENVFGYVPRYAEYRYKPSAVHGDFRDTLAYWHLGRIFEDRPALNEEFIQCVPSQRIFAVQDIPDDGGEEPTPVRDVHTIYAHVYFDIEAIRPIPKFGIPTL